VNASEISAIEERLTGSYALPVSQEHVEYIVRRAKEQRAVYLRQLLASVPVAVARFAEGIRETAANCTAARMHHS
jgi:hypothetical protein